MLNADRKLVTIITEAVLEAARRDLDANDLGSAARAVNALEGVEGAQVWARAAAARVAVDAAMADIVAHALSDMAAGTGSGRHGGG